MLRLFHALRPRRLCAALGLAVAAFGLAACGDGFAPASPTLQPDAPAVEAARRDSVLAVLADLRRTAIDSAFGRLSDYTYRRTRRTAALHDADAAEAPTRTSVVRFTRADDGRRIEPVEIDSSGSFEEAPFGWFGGLATLREDTTELAPYILSDDPPYESGRGREAFLFRLRPDTLLDGRPTRVVLIEPHPTEGEGQQLRHVRLFIDRASNELAAIDVVRTQDALLYGERSRNFLKIQRLPDGAWVPDSLRIDTRFAPAGASTREVRTSARYSDFALRR